MTAQCKYCRDKSSNWNSSGMGCGGKLIASLNLENNNMFKQEESSFCFLLGSIFTYQLHNVLKLNIT